MSAVESHAPRTTDGESGLPLDRFDPDDARLKGDPPRDGSEPPSERFTSPAAWARAYAQLGLALVPIPPGQKAPQTQDWPNQAISDPLLADAHWDANPDDNIGAVLGPSRLISFDVDAPEWARIALSAAGFDIDLILAAGVAVEGNPAKAKRLFRAPPGFNLPTRKLSWPADPASEPDADGKRKRPMLLELRFGDGLQDVLPPSIHPGTGRPYRFLQGRDPWSMGGFPDPVEELLRLWRSWDSVRALLALACPWRKVDESDLRATAQRFGGDSEWDRVRDEIKRQLTVRSVLERHGVAIHGRRFSCPIHPPDRHPSAWLWSSPDGVEHLVCAHGGSEIGIQTRNGQLMADVVSVEGWYRRLPPGKATAELARELGIEMPGSAPPPEPEPPPDEPSEPTSSGQGKHRKKPENVRKIIWRLALVGRDPVSIVETAVRANSLAGPDEFLSAGEIERRVSSAVRRVEAWRHRVVDLARIDEEATPEQILERLIDEEPRFEKLTGGLSFVRSTLRLDRQAAGIGCQTTDVVEQFRLTDTGNAERFIADHGSDVRYCDPMGGWQIWDGSRWTRDQTEDVVERMKGTARSIWREAKGKADVPSVYEALVKHAKQSANAGKIEAALRLARVDRNVAAVAAQFDAEHTRHLLNVRNGTIDLRTGELLRHDRNLLITRLAPVAYEPSAQAPRWIQFLDEIFEGDHALIAWMRVLIGYSLTGLTSEHIFVVAHGSGRNGKSTLVEVLKRLAGDYAATLNPAVLVATKHGRAAGAATPEIAKLRGARIVFAVETDEGERFNESVAKAMAGGDSMTARHLHKEEFEFEPEFQPWLSTNYRPAVRAGGLGFWSRVRLIPFNRRFEGSARDTTLREKLLAERPGILAWVVGGAREFFENGERLPDPPEAVLAATDEYREAENPLGGFLEAECVLDPDARVAREAFRSRYVAWFQRQPESERRGKEPMSAQKLYSLTQGMGVAAKKVRGERYFAGIGLRDVG